MKTSPTVDDLRSDYKKYNDDRNRRRLELQKILSKDLTCFDRLKIYIRSYFESP